MREDLGKHVRERPAVLEDVRDARRVAQVVLEHAELAGLVADEVDARHVDAHLVGGLDPPRLAVEVGRRGHQAARDQSVVEDVAGAVDIGEEGLEGVQPLDDAGLDVLPLRGSEQAGHEVHGQRPLALAEGERDAMPVEVGVALPGPLRQSCGTERHEGLVHVGVGGTRLAAVDEHLVERHDCARRRQLKLVHPTPSGSPDHHYVTQRTLDRSCFGRIAQDNDAEALGQPPSRGVLPLGWQTKPGIPHEWCRAHHGHVWRRRP